MNRIALNSTIVNEILSLKCDSYTLNSGRIVASSETITTIIAVSDGLLGEIITAHMQ